MNLIEKYLGEAKPEIIGRGVTNTGQKLEIGFEKGMYYGELRDPDTKLVDSATNAKSMADIWKWAKDHKVKKIKWEDGKSGTI
jgi:hypothetical protein